MQFVALVALLLLTQVVPKNDPTGIWRATSGLEFELRQVGPDLQVQLIPASTTRYLEYAVNLEGTEEPNTYQGLGHFKAKLENGRECEFETEWQVIVVAPDRIIGVGSQIIPDPETCEIVETGELPIDLARKQ